MFMLNTMESQRNVGEHLVPVPQYSDYHHYKAPAYDNSYNQMIKHRSGRQVVFDFPSVASSLFNRSKFNDIPTTPSSDKLWTTVFPNFGPLGITNPKAVVTENRHGAMNASTFVAYPIGNADWTKNIPAKPTLLNYSTTVQAVLSAARLSTDWYEECWENLIGEFKKLKEITKLVTTDLVMTIASILVIDFLRALWVRYTNIWWFWNLETTFPEYGEFKVAENVLHLVNNQGMIWLGLFFVPMLPAINNIKLIILMYIRGWAVMTCNVPARQIFRASRSSNFYLMLLLLMLFLCTLPVGYVIASKKPSKICGPFGSQERFYSIIVQLLDRNLTKGLVDAIRYMISPGIVIPVLLLLLLTIYFLFALVRGLREANTDLTKQLLHKRSAPISNPDITHPRPTLLPIKSSDNNNQTNKIINITDHDHTPEKLYKRNSKDLHSYVPSLKSVSEAEHSESDEEPDHKLKQPLKEVEESKIVETKRGWKQRIMIWLGLNEELNRPRKLRSRYDQEDVETGNESPISVKKSGASDDQCSSTSVSELCLHSSSVKQNQKQTISKHLSRPQQTFELHEIFMETTVPLLEPVKDRFVCQALQEKQRNHDSNTSASDDSFHESLKDVENREYESFGLSDPRFSYADPYSSYANAMMSPLMEMQTLSSTACSEKEILVVEDEFNKSTGVTQYLENYKRRNNYGKINDKEDKYEKLKLDVRQKTEQNKMIQEMKSNDGNIIVHPEMHIPATISDTSDTNKKHKKEMDNINRSSPLPQIKLGKVEARVFLRESKPKSHYSEASQRPQISSDSESRMLVVGEDPRLYYTDSELPYYARVSNTQEAVQADTLVQQFLMRVNISEARSSFLSDPSPPSSSSKHPMREAETAMDRLQHTMNQRKLSSNETTRIHCKHTFV
ncbi:hypothetical protein DINM_006604 [Dirofilaria immitis]|nr:hypothetical protein [Dirofilaria immitis]